jgi:hypothetical protein
VIPLIAAAALLLVALVLGAGVFTVRQRATEQRDAEHVAVMRFEEAEMARAEHAGPEPFNGAVAAAGGVNVQSLAQQYRTDEVSAAEKYTGRRIRCAGFVHTVEKLEDGSYVMSFVDGQMEKSAVRAYFPAGEAEKLTKFEFRSPVHFGGTCAGWDRKVAPPEIAIRDCHVVPAPPKKGPLLKQDRPR